MRIRNVCILFVEVKMPKDVKENEPLVYIPPGAKINVENISNEPPPTRYERHRWTFDINLVKNIVKGIYGKKDE